MIQVQKMMELQQPFISAASGLVTIQNKFIVIGDDENFLGIYDLKNPVGVAISVFKEILPPDKDLRKKNKNDFEALVHLSLQKQLLVVPSGSTSRRERGALVDEAGQWVQEVSFHALYSSLKVTLSELNIEGGVVIGENLCLLQRGNGVKNQNALVKFNLRDFLEGLPLFPEVTVVKLGSFKDVNLSFTDATCLNDNILFLAVAEDTQSTYLDGAVVGSVIGIMNYSGEILQVQGLDTDSKPEGLCYNASEKCFYLVTDDDDRSIPAKLYRGFLPASWA